MTRSRIPAPRAGRRREKWWDCRQNDFKLITRSPAVKSEALSRTADPSAQNIMESLEGPYRPRPAAWNESSSHWGWSEIESGHSVTQTAHCARSARHQTPMHRDPQGMSGPESVAAVRGGSGSLKGSGGSSRRAANRTAGGGGGLNGNTNWCAAWLPGPDLNVVALNVVQTS